MRAHVLSAATAVCAAASAHAQINDVLHVDFTNAGFFDSFGDIDNVASVVDVNAAFGLASGQQVVVTSIGWDITIETVSPSWLGDAVVHVDDANAVFPPSIGAFNLVPGENDLFAGTKAYNSGGLQSLASLGINDLVLSGGNLYLELFDSFDDFADAEDAYLTGTVSFGVTLVPAPGSLLIAGVGFSLVSRRRR